MPICHALVRGEEKAITETQRKFFAMHGLKLPRTGIVRLEDGHYTVRVPRTINHAGYLTKVGEIPLWLVAAWNVYADNHTA